MTSKHKSDLVVIGDAWHDCSPAYQQLFNHLARERQILWVTLPGQQPGDAPHEQLPVTMMSLPLKSVLSPIAHWWPKWHQQRLANQIRDTIASLNLHQPLVLLLAQAAYPIAEKLTEHRMIYLRSRNSRQHADATPDHEESVIARADLVIAETVELARPLPAVKTSLLQGESWIEALPRPRDLPRGRPVAGFHGPLDDTLDWELLSQTARRRPDWYWVLIGPRQTSALDPLLQLRNVFWLGEKNFEQVAAYRQHWQLTIMPYRNEPSVTAKIPLSMQQALRCDKPLVVSADFAELPSFKPLLSKIHTMQEFSELLPIVAQTRSGPEESTSPHLVSLSHKRAATASLCELGVRELDGVLDSLS